MLTPMDSRKLAHLCRELAENKKAENTVILDMRKLSSVTDYYVIATGTSEPHLRALMEEIADQLKKQYDLRPRARDGLAGTPWTVLDYDQVVVHIMRKETRSLYDLEGLWKQARLVVRVQ